MQSPNRQSQASTPTLVVFTLGAARETRRRPLLPARLAAEEMAVRQACLEQVLDAGRACGCRLVVCSPQPLGRLGEDALRSPQRGRGFGQRLEAAVEAALEQAAGPVLVVGTDSPGLRVDHLRDALDALERDPGRVVLGPSPDGGLYLLGMDRSLGDALTSVRWCRRDTLSSLLRVLEARGRSVALLSPLGDLDTPRDLHAWLRRARAAAPRLAPLIRRLLEALARLRRPPASPWQAPRRPAPVAIRASRAPPRRPPFPSR